MIINKLLGIHQRMPSGWHSTHFSLVHAQEGKGWVGVCLSLVVVAEQLSEWLNCHHVESSTLSLCPLGVHSLVSAILLCVRWPLTVVLIYVSLGGSDDDQLFTCWWASCIFFFYMKCLYLALSKFGLIVFSYWFVGALYVFFSFGGGTRDWTQCCLTTELHP